MKNGNLGEVTGKALAGWCEWLARGGEGCCSLCFATDGEWNYAVCVGWHDTSGEGEWKLAWKIGRQKTNNAMQSDMDVDFEMPYNEETGDVDNTLELIETTGHGPAGYASWADLAETIRAAAKRVASDWIRNAD